MSKYTQLPRSSRDNPSTWLEDLLKSRAIFRQKDLLISHKHENMWKIDFSWKTFEKTKNSYLFVFFSLFWVRKNFLTVSDLFYLHKEVNNWLEKPILWCRAEGETLQRLQEPIVYFRVKVQQVTNSKKNFEHSKKREKKMNRLLFSIFGVFLRI